MIYHTVKIWVTVMYRRLREETRIGEGQFGVIPGRWTTNAIFAAWQVMEKHRYTEGTAHGGDWSREGI